MKSKTLNPGDKVLITQDFIDRMIKVNPQYNKTIWQLGTVATIDRITEFSTVRIYKGIWSIFVTNDLAEEMNVDYLAQKKGMIL